MKIPECSFQRRPVFVALPLFGDRVSEYSVLLIRALMHRVNPLHRRVPTMSIVCLAAAPFSSAPFSCHCLPVADLIVILPLLGFNLRSLSGPRGAAGSPRSPLAPGQRPFELPSQPRLSVPLLCVPAWLLPGCWRGPLIYCRWLGQPPRSFHSGLGIIYFRHIWQGWHLGPL